MNQSLTSQLDGNFEKKMHMETLKLILALSSLVSLFNLVCF